MKITANATKSSHQDRGSCFLHLPIFFLYKYTALLLQNKKLLSSLLFLSKVDHRSLFNYTLRDYSHVRIDFSMISKQSPDSAYGIHHVSLNPLSFDYCCFSQS